MWNYREKALIRKTQVLRTLGQGERKEFFSVFHFNICCDLIMHAFKITLPGHQDPVTLWLPPSQGSFDGYVSNSFHDRPVTFDF